MGIGNDFEIAIALYQKIQGKFELIACIKNAAIKINYHQTMVFARNKLKVEVMNLSPEVQQKINTLTIGVPMGGKNTRPAIFGNIEMIEGNRYTSIASKRFLTINTMLEGELNTTSKTVLESQTGILGGESIGAVNVKGNIYDVFKKLIESSGRGSVKHNADSNFQAELKKQAMSEFAFSGSFADCIKLITQEIQENKGVIHENITLPSIPEAEAGKQDGAEEVYIDYRDSKMIATYGIIVTDENIIGNFNPLSGEFTVSIPYQHGVKVGSFIELKSVLRKDLNDFYKIISMITEINYDPSNKANRAVLHLKVSKKITSFLKS